MPGIDPVALNQLVPAERVGYSGLAQHARLAGGALGRMAIFALNIMPYISASIIMQLMTTVSPHLEQLKKEGEHGPQNRSTSIPATARSFLAAMQAYGIAIGLEGSVWQ